jgi:hypothetical protein
VAGVVALAFHLPLIALGIITFGAGAGISYIVRGTLPLALFGAAGYATLMGKLALAEPCRAGASTLGRCIGFHPYWN